MGDTLNARVERIDVNDTRLAYVESGAGEPVVFVHGVLNDFRSWMRQLQVFGSQYRAVAMSCRHYYPNEPIADDESLHLDVLADDLGAFLRTLDLVPAHLVGASNGAIVCLLLALRERGLVRSLVLAEPPLLPALGVSVPPQPGQILRLLMRNPRAALAVVRFGAKGIGPAFRAFRRGDDDGGLQIFTRAVLGRQAAAAMTDSMKQQSRDNLKPFKARLRAGFPPFSEAEARRINVPTLIVEGAHSAPVLHAIGRTLLRSMPHVERVEIPSASHLMYESHAEAFNAAVLGFLRRHRAADA